QRVEIDGVVAKMREQLKALNGNHGAEGKALADAMRDGKLDRNEVLGALGKGDELRQKREAIFADAIVGIYGKLDAAQRTKLTSMVEEHGMKAVIGHHGMHRGHGKNGQKPGKVDGAKGQRRAQKAARGDRERGSKLAKADRKASKLARFGRV